MIALELRCTAEEQKKEMRDRSWRVERMRDHHSAHDAGKYVAY